MINKTNIEDFLIFLFITVIVPVLTGFIYDVDMFSIYAVSFISIIIYLILHNVHKIRKLLEYKFIKGARLNDF
jgi:hypothetical protein